MKDINNCKIKVTGSGKWRGLSTSGEGLLPTRMIDTWPRGSDNTAANWNGYCNGMVLSSQTGAKLYLIKPCHLSF